MGSMRAVLSMGHLGMHAVRHVAQGADLSQLQDQNL